MNDLLRQLIERQRQRMRELRDDASDLADTVADEAWDKFEIAIDEATEDSYMFDFASSTQISLAATLWLSYDEAFERHVLALLERLEWELRAAGAPESCLEVARIALAGLRKGLKLQLQAHELIGQAIERAKPGLIGMLFMSRDPTSDAWDEELRDNARRRREKLLDLRGKIIELIRAETMAAIQAARLYYNRGARPSFP